MNRRPTSQSISRIAPYLIFLSLVVFHFIWIARNSVDIPEWDEWGMLGGLTLAKEHHLVRWMFMLHNEHEIIPTKIQVWLSYHLNGWNIYNNILFNYLLYCCLPAGLLIWIRRNRLPVSGGTIALFCCFLFSPILNENFLWSLQSCFHFVLLFSFAGTLLLFSPSQSWAKVLAGSGCFAAAIFSLASGLPMALGALSVFTWFKFRRANAKENRPREIAQWLTAIILVALAGVAFMMLLRQAGLQPGSRGLKPFSTAKYFFNLVSLGFGITYVSAILGAFCFALVIAPLYSLWQAPETRQTQSLWILTAWISCLVAGLLAIAVGRSQLFSINLSKSSRYAEISLCLLVLGVTAWAWALSAQPLRQRVILVVFFLGLCGTFANDWYFGIYPEVARRRRESVACVQRYFDTKIVEHCPTVSPSPIPFHFDQAKDLNVSFYRNLKR